MSPKSFCALLCICLMIPGCIAFRKKKSEKYYFDHEVQIREILGQYQTLNNHLPFSFGFSNKSLIHFSMDINTDTMRYSLNNEQGMQHFLTEAGKFGFDTSALNALYNKLYQLKAIRIGRTDMFSPGFEERATLLSFRSAISGNPFLDGKYYNLIFFQPTFISTHTDSLVRSQGFTYISDDVYFKIMGSFR